jgi:protein phosphatase
MRLRIAAATDVGRVREQNEDSYLASKPLFAVADGMGGHQAGEVASKLALDVLQSWRDEHAADGADRLRDAVVEANRAVWERGQQERALRGMGTTLTAAWLEGETVTIAHVGDSRAYLLHGGELHQLTEDQTVVQDMVNEGRITPEEAFRHPSRSILKQALGGGPDVEVDGVSFELQPGDRLILASDGLHGIVTNERIAQILLAEHDPDGACHALVDAANEAGGDDNITVIILEADPDSAGDDDEPAPAAPVIVSKPGTGRATPVARRAFRRRLAITIAAAMVLLVVIAAMALTRSASNRWFVAARGDTVAIVKGSSAQDGKVIRLTDVRVSSLAPNFQRTVRSGIRVDSQADADRTVNNLPQVLGPSDTPVPTETPLPTPATSP